MRAVLTRDLVCAWQEDDAGFRSGAVPASLRRGIGDSAVVPLRLVHRLSAHRLVAES